MSTTNGDNFIEDGYVYCTRVKHWRTGNFIYPKKSKYFRFKVGK